MSLVLGVDIGTTSISCLAWDTSTGRVVALDSQPNDALTSARQDRAQGRSEWDAEAMVETAFRALARVVQQLGSRQTNVLGVGITGQQHGVLMLDAAGRPLTPLINWQDRRGEDPFPGTDRTYVQQAAHLAGDQAPSCAGCRLATGYMGVTLFWMKQQESLPAGGTACFVMDYFASALTDAPPRTDPSSAASSGLLHVRTRQWDYELIHRLGLPADIFPAICEAPSRLGSVSARAAVRSGLPAGLPVFVAIGDNQASFLASVSRPQESVLINVGTGGQVGAFTESFYYTEELETRPFPQSGNLLVRAGLCGGRSYAALRTFFQDVASHVLGRRVDLPSYEGMNQAAAGVARGSDGLRCQPLFTGTRAQPHLRGSWSGMSPENFTAAHMSRALLEGLAEIFFESYTLIEHTAGRTYERLVGAGNGLRQNPLLVQILSDRFGRPLVLAQQQEEAAVGAALVAAVGAGACRDWPDTARVLDRSQREGEL